eukprot:Lankesteria_metandrocarpae@DN4044_c0_g1_i1.p1
MWYNNEDAVQATTDEATISKVSASEHGYYADPYISCFVSRNTKRSPLINRGYYVRVAALRKIIKRFCSLFANCQIVNLGAGLDSVAFFVAENCPSAVCFEVDFTPVVIRKSRVIRRHTKLQELIGSPRELSAESCRDCPDLGSMQSVQSKRLRLVPADLRDTALLSKSLTACGFDSRVPTLFLAECVLIYMKASESDPVVQWASSAVSSASCFVTYEQINPHDAFGTVMMRNLLERGCPLRGIEKYPTLESQFKRYHSLGWTGSSALTMNQIYDTYLDREDVKRVEKLELFDEIEEWRLFGDHYFINVASNDHWGTPPVEVSQHFLSLGDSNAQTSPQV